MTRKGSPYTCPKCKRRKFRTVYEDTCKCEACGFIGSAYLVPMDQWDTIEFGGKETKKKRRRA